jgi:hypothetical protein
VKKLSNFLRTKGSGNAGELLVKGLFEDAGIYCELVVGRNSDYDMGCSLNGLVFFVEIKNDVKAALTKNIAIEFYNTKSGKPSGLSITKADIWAHIVQREVYLIKVETLKELCQKTPPSKIVQGGDDNAFIYLYDKSILQFFFLCKDSEDLITFLEKTLA